MTDAEWDSLSDWEKQEWFEEIHPIMEILMQVKPLVICELGPDVLADLGEE